MDCIFSTPVDFEGNPPDILTNDFEFSEVSCEINWPELGVISSTPSATVDIASDSAIAKGFHDYTYFSWFLACIIILYVGFRIGTYIYKR